MSGKPEILILGIGNILLKDDGIGVHVIHQILNSGAAIPGNVTLLDGGTAGFNLLPELAGPDRIIIVDALKMHDTPGSIYRFPAAYSKTVRGIFLVPVFSIKALLAQVRWTGFNPEVEIIGIVPEDINTREIGLSDSVNNALPKAVQITMEAAGLKVI